MGRRRRWAAVVAAVVALVAVPSLVSALPARDSDVTAAELLARIRGSAGVAFEGYAEPTARFQFPDVPAVGGVLELLGETSALRVWWRSPERWRVDQLSPVGEHGTYRFDAGHWLWDSFDRRATRVDGFPSVRLVRAPDLLPTELGRRLAGAAAPDEITRIEPIRVAGRSAAGLRITPRTPDTTVGRVDVWADARTGVPLAVEVTARGTTTPMIDTRFLDFRFGDPPDDVLAFVPPYDADVDVSIAEDLAERADRYSAFVVPDEVAGRPRRTSIATGAGTYGDGFALVAVLALERGRVERARRRLDGPLTPTVTGPYGDATVVETPLLNGLLFVSGDVGYAVSGTVPRRVLEAVATDLAGR